MFKIIDPCGWDWHGEPVLSAIHVSRRGLRGNDLKEFRKRASDDLVRKVASSDIKPDELLVHGLAVGDYETTGPNRKGDAFDRHTCQTRHHTFKKFARWYRNHQDDDPHNSFGRIVTSDYIQPMGRIELLAGLNMNKKAADRNGGKIASFEINKLESGDDLPISMGARVRHDVCTACGNKAKTAADYCDESNCPAGGCKNYLGKLRKQGNDMVHLGVFNPGCYFVDISTVHRPAGRTSYATLADYTRKAASDSDQERIIGSAEMAQQLGLQGPTWLVISNNPEATARIKLAGMLWQMGNTTMGGNVACQWDCELPQLAKRITARDLHSQLATLANRGIFADIEAFADLTGRSAHVQSARGQIYNAYKRAADTGDDYESDSDRWATADDEDFSVKHAAQELSAELGVETGFTTRAIRSSVSELKPRLPYGPDTLEGRKLAADYVDYRLSALSRYLPVAVDPLLTLKCAIRKIDKCELVRISFPYKEVTMTTTRKTLSLTQRLDALLVTGKTASDVAVAPPKKAQAAAESEPDVTNMEGSTESKSKDVDDQVEPNTEGSHAKTNDKEVKDVGVEPLDKTAMDKLTKTLSKTADEGGMDHTRAHDSIRLTGEDPKNELSGVMGNTNKDPGSTTPMRTDNSELDGKKWASMELAELYPHFNKSAGDLMLLLGDVASELEVAPTTPKTAADGKSAATPAVVPADATKAVTAEDCSATLYEFINMGSHRADLVGTHLKKVAADRIKSVTPARQPAKRAEDGPPPPPADAGGGAPPVPPAGGMGGDMGGAGMGGSPPGGDAGAGGEPSMEQIVAELQAAGIPPEEIQKLLASVGGGGDGAPGGAPAGPDAGGPPPAADAGGPPPTDPKTASDKGKVPSKLNRKVAMNMAIELLRRSQ